MKKIIAIIIIFLISFVAILTILNLKEVKNYVITVPKDEVFTQYNQFDIYNIKAADDENNNLINYVCVYGLELLNLEHDRITEYGSFNLRYTIEIDNEVVAHAYRNIKVIYDRNNLNGLLYNSDFLANINEWGIVDWQKSLDINIENGQLMIIQNSVDSYIWDQSIYQYVENLEINKKYKISFDVSSNYSKTIKVCLAQPLSSSPWSYNVMNEYDLVIDDQLKTYEIEFTCTYPNNIVEEHEFYLNNVRLEFKFGKFEDLNNINSLIVFDNINIYEI